jgi:hypothetical protein
MRLLAFLSAAILLAGCFGGDEATPSSTTTSSSATSSATNSTTTAPPVANNTAPVANLTASAQNGTAPFSVTFNLTASDIDGDNLTWTFDADGNGSAEANGTGAQLPLSIQFNYTSAGSYNATFNVTDGRLATQAVLVITVTSGGGTGGPPADDGLPWANVDELGQCHADGGFIQSAGPLWIHDRTTMGAPGTGLADPNGGGTWIYEESNGVPGLQIGGAGEEGPYVGCVNPDLLIF